MPASSVKVFKSKLVDQWMKAKRLSGQNYTVLLKAFLIEKVLRAHFAFFIHPCVSSQVTTQFTRSNGNTEHVLNKAILRLHRTMAGFV